MRILRQLVFTLVLLAALTPAAELAAQKTKPQGLPELACTPAVYFREDINLDGKVNITDVVTILHLLEEDPENPRVDYNEDGTPELAEAVADASKQKFVYAFSAGLMCSAAYWVASQADAIYAKASLKNIRVDDLKKAAHHLRQSGDAIAKGEIQQVREHRRLAVSSLRRAQSRLEADPTGAMPMDPPAGLLDDVVESGPDHAPPQFRDQVSNYYKALNDSL